MVVFGTSYAFGVFYDVFTREFAVSRSVLALVFGVQTAFVYIVGVGSGWLVDRYGQRQVVVGSTFVERAHQRFDRGKNVILQRSVDPIMSDEVVTATVTEGVGCMRIERPESLNAFTPRVLEKLLEAVQSFEADDDVRAIMFTGAGEKAFCAGVDLGDEGGINQSTPAALDTVHRAQRVLKALRRTPLPVVCAVNGYAMGAGMDLALGCDVRVVRADAEMSQSYVNVGLSPGDGGAYLLPRLVGEEVAKDLIFSGRRITGTEARDLGIASVVVDGDADQTRDIALERARELANGPTVALGRSKRLVNEAHDVNLETGLEHAIESLADCRETDDHAEAVAAFAEEREPDFRGE